MMGLLMIMTTLVILLMITLYKVYTNMSYLMRANRVICFNQTGHFNNGI